MASRAIMNLPDVSSLPIVPFPPNKEIAMMLRHDDATDGLLMLCASALASVENRALCPNEISEICKSRGWTYSGTQPFALVSTCIRTHVRRAATGSKPYAPLFSPYELNGPVPAEDIPGMGIDKDGKPVIKRGTLWYLSEKGAGYPSPFTSAGSRTAGSRGKITQLPIVSAEYAKRPPPPLNVKKGSKPSESAYSKAAVAPLTGQRSRTASSTPMQVVAASSGRSGHQRSFSMSLPASASYRQGSLELDPSGEEGEESMGRGKRKRRASAIAASSAWENEIRPALSMTQSGPASMQRSTSPKYNIGAHRRTQSVTPPIAFSNEQAGGTTRKLKFKLAPLLERAAKDGSSDVEVATSDDETDDDDALKLIKRARRKSDSEATSPRLAAKPQNRLARPSFLSQSYNSSMRPSATSLSLRMKSLGCDSEAGSGEDDGRAPDLQQAMLTACDEFEFAFDHAFGASEEAAKAAEQDEAKRDSIELPTKRRSGEFDWNDDEAPAGDVDTPATTPRSYCPPTAALSPAFESDSDDSSSSEGDDEEEDDAMDTAPDSPRLSPLDVTLCPHAEAQPPSSLDEASKVSTTPIDDQVQSAEEVPEPLPTLLSMPLAPTAGFAPALGQAVDGQDDIEMELVHVDSITDDGSTDDSSISDSDSFSGTELLLNRRLSLDYDPTTSLSSLTLNQRRGSGTATSVESAGPSPTEEKLNSTAWAVDALKASSSPLESPSQTTEVAAQSFSRILASDILCPESVGLDELDQVFTKEDQEAYAACARMQAISLPNASFFLAQPPLLTRRKTQPIVAAPAQEPEALSPVPCSTLSPPTSDKEVADIIVYPMSVTQPLITARFTRFESETTARSPVPSVPVYSINVVRGDGVALPLLRRIDDDFVNVSTLVQSGAQSRDIANRLQTLQALDDTVTMTGGVGVAGIWAPLQTAKELARLHIKSASALNAFLADDVHRLFPEPLPQMRETLRSARVEKMAHEQTSDQPNPTVRTSRRRTAGRA
ncbi:hypothetical protein E5Q_00730 [Mixia osmundae IAM 14324]|uniref:HTH APSES-type domain-containing protein n=1 Tax=Mixia osmundae (strain CBS 9802 / IAM 14324 / JCM 22182 / KY 12970) TaxID=764103 RepID=G7DU23_MIXOS|nr:hypothetical protein E5Q_00730 [Mixia osmundae IAM 14324]